MEEYSLESLFRTINVHDHGFVRLVDMMPYPDVDFFQEQGITNADAAIVQSARVSYAAGTKKVSTDKGLIDYLLRNSHSTPFEMVEFKFHAKMPLFVARQWIRHRTANVNEVSARYSVVEDSYYVPSKSNCQEQSKSNRQGGEGQIASPKEARNMIDSLSQESYKIYCQLLAKNDYEATDKRFGDELEHFGLSRELSRMVLPLNYYTEWYWKIDLHNLFHFLRLRMDSHAQKEIRDYASSMFKIVNLACPSACSSFIDHKVSSLTLSGTEKAIINISFVNLFINKENFNEEVLFERLEENTNRLMHQASERRKKEVLEKIKTLFTQRM